MSQVIPRHTHYSTFSYYGENNVSPAGVWVRPFARTYTNDNGGTAKVLHFGSYEGLYVESVDSSTSQYAQTGTYGSGNYVRPNSRQVRFIIKYQ